MTITNYLEIVNSRYQSGISREHSYRADLENLLRSILTNIDITNEPANVTDCGNPDYVLTNGKIPIGYIEAKDVGKDLNSKVYKEQFSRYRNALDNLIITDYLWFQFFQNGILVHEIKLAEIENGKIVPIPENFQQFENLIKNFCSFIGQTIKSAKRLAEMMAAKARLLQNILENAITSDEETQENTSLQGQFHTFKEILIHDLTPKGFADIYAQTLAYGMFAARLHDPTLNDFSRQEAAELIPKSNPFLRKLFGYVAGPDIDARIKPTVDNLADVFRATNVERLLKNFGKSTQTQDAIIHFYETFLAEYDPKLRKARGVWYTPEPVVKFIVRAVDDVLKTEFKLPQGLADTSKTKIKVNTDVADKRSTTGYKQTEKEVHKVQILDPATGTGTFLAEVVNYIYSKKFKAMQGAWSGYVEQHLIPRLNGFELLMASYAMAHLKLEMLLRETGYKEDSTQRLNVYLTNSLEEHHKDTGTLFSNWLSTEANEANHIKRDTPVMCVIGNPPYSGISSNNGKWIADLIEDYKYVDGEHFNERKHWLNDDYVKFMRYGQHFIEKNGEGILAFINPHGFLDNPTFRGMRWNLLKTYDKIYTIDLHGNAKKKETAPDGNKDENVFDIMQGVSINILIKTGQKKTNQLGQVYHYDCYGKRNDKYDFLANNNLKDIVFENLNYTQPYYFFVPTNEEGRKKYEAGFSFSKIFLKNVSGIVTARDSVVTDFSQESLLERIRKFANDKYSDSEIRTYLFPNKKDGKYLAGDSRGWKLSEARKKVTNNNHLNLIKDFNYRPFDTRKIYYSPSMVDWGREVYMQHFLRGENVGIILPKQVPDKENAGAFLTRILSGHKTCSAYNINNIFPLYLYPETTKQQSTETRAERMPNLDPKILAKIEESLGLDFVPEVEDDNVCLANSGEVRGDFRSTFAPIHLLDYIYAILHSPTYRETYKEFLKIDFPRVPYPKDQEEFWKLVKLGGELRQIHLLESHKSEEFITTYPVDGDNIITRKITKTSPGFELTNPDEKTGKVWINDEQYFDKVPEIAWEFYIGGYQPAQKWLKDRKGRELKFEDLLHYQKIIVALTETDRLMKEIDNIKI
ncbi:type ISP restriction/modification enzyme [Salegentibacter sp. F188]|uniref:site-specific DNA-methyltransferase (adenine-specific) n=1 Tax=Autumnicola patrickiae TaxID=3075591 RepID=A0ABU3DZU2_9FLAO|nr:type ISP restriction/modification enzyme [Salegentibacter sp. F188]MDT0689246.1 type ISP restriction/modification enzyme [Salegentibacter sp. F188]